MARSMTHTHVAELLHYSCTLQELKLLELKLLVAGMSVDSSVHNATVNAAFYLSPTELQDPLCRKKQSYVILLY